MSASDSPKTVNVPLAENESATVTVTTDGGATTLVDAEQVTRDCDEPVVTTSTCTEIGALVVGVTEDAQDTYTITVDGTGIEGPQQQSSDGATADYTAVFDVPDGDYTVTVTSGTGYTSTTSVTVDCDEPVVEIAQSCVDHDGTVVVTITETPADTFSVQLDDGEWVKAAEGQVVFEDVADGSHHITVYETAPRAPSTRRPSRSTVTRLLHPRRPVTGSRMSTCSARPTAPRSP